MQSFRMNHIIFDCLNSVPAVEGFQIIDITEDGFLLAGDFRRCAFLIHMLQMVWRDEFYLLQKLSFCADQLLDKLTRYKWNRGRITKVVQNIMHILNALKIVQIYQSFFLYSVSVTSSLVVSGRSATSADSCNTTNWSLVRNFKTHKQMHNF